ncbi:MAG: hypothetical protein AAFU60_13055, partial [Bacteroidota bacterium]
HLSPALAALQRGDQVSLYLPNPHSQTSAVLQEVANSWSISTLAECSVFDPGTHSESFLWWQSSTVPASAFLDSFRMKSLCIPSPIPLFLDESANVEQAKTLLRVLWEKKAPGFLPKQFWVPRSLESEIMEFLLELGEPVVQGEVDSMSWKEQGSLCMITYRSVRQVTEMISKQGTPNLIYWFSRYKPTVKAVQRVTSLCGIALNGILPSLRQQEMEIGPHRAQWVGSQQEVLGFNSVIG